MHKPNPNDRRLLHPAAPESALRPWLQQRPGVPHREPLVKEIFDVYLRVAGPELSPAALDDFRRVLAAFAADFGDTPVIGLRQIDLMLWVKKHPEWKSPWTRKRVIQTVKRPFNWAVRLGELHYNPLLGATSPAGEPGRPMTDAEFNAILRSTSAVFRRVLVFLRFSGARPGELAAAKWTDLDLERGVITLHKHKTAKKTRRPRVIALNAVLVKLLIWLRRNRPGLNATATRLRQLLARGPRPAQEVIRQLRAEGVTYRMLHCARRAAGVRIVAKGGEVERRVYELRDPPAPGEEVGFNPHIFLGAKGTPWTRYSMACRMKRLRDQASILPGCKIYGLRHAFATRAILNAVDIKTLAELLGHADTRMTEHYLHLSGRTDHLTDAVNQATRPKPL
jgi:integrase